MKARLLALHPWEAEVAQAAAEAAEQVAMEAAVMAMVEIAAVEMAMALLEEQEARIQEGQEPTQDALVRQLARRDPDWALFWF